MSSCIDSAVRSVTFSLSAAFFIYTISSSAFPASIFTECPCLHCGDVCTIPAVNVRTLFPLAFGHLPFAPSGRPPRLGCYSVYLYIAINITISSFTPFVLFSSSPVSFVIRRIKLFSHPSSRLYSFMTVGRCCTSFRSYNHLANKVARVRSTYSKVSEIGPANTVTSPIASFLSTPKSVLNKTIDDIMLND